MGVNLKRVRIDDSDLAQESAEFGERLAQAHAAKCRPLCLCRTPGVPMYVAHFGDRFILKRMPETGPRHDPSCDSYEAPYELSGFGHVSGGAIQESVEDGVTRLKLDFSLSKTGAKAPAATKEGTDTGAANADGAKLSLRSLLHYLWDQAEFNRWRPRMAGKRNWAVIRKFLIEAAEGKTAKGKALSEALFIPEMFALDREAEIAERRTASLRPLFASDKRGRPLMVLIGEVKEIALARFGHRLVVKHLPKFPFLLDEDIHRRMAAKFAAELSLWSATPDAHLIVIATFGQNPTGVAMIDSIALMTVTENWIPFEHSFDAALLEGLTRVGASFLKGLRYNLPGEQPLASVVLREDGVEPTALYIVPPGADEAYRTALDALTGQSELATWIWKAGVEEMPSLPAMTV